MGQKVSFLEPCCRSGCFVKSPKGWLGDFKEENYLEWSKNKQSLTYNFITDMSFLFTLFQICTFSESYEKFAVEVARNNKQSEDVSVFYDIKYKDVDESKETNTYEQVKENYSELDNNIRLKLFELISKKYVIGHFTWTFFATMITFFASINALI